MDINNAFADPNIEIDGVWIDYRDGSRIKVARVGNPNYRRINAIKFKPHQKKQRLGTLDDETETRILCEVLAKTILLDWEGFEKNGKTLKYSSDVAFDLLLTHMDFRNDLVDIATKEELFFQESLEDSEKN